MMCVRQGFASFRKKEFNKVAAESSVPDFEEQLFTANDKTTCYSCSLFMPEMNLRTVFYVVKIHLMKKHCQRHNGPEG